MSGRALLLGVLLAAASCGPANPYHSPTDTERADIVGAVREYYAARNQLTGGLDIEDFWRRYPSLAVEHDLARGINTEVMLWRWSHDPQLRRMNYRTDLESYAPIHAFVRGGEAVAIVHGLEAWDYPNGSVTKGEFHTAISLRTVDGRWTVVKTDEQVMGERAPSDPPTR